jgi:hypothetical protein
MLSMTMPPYLNNCMKNMFLFRRDGAAFYIKFETRFHHDSASVLSGAVIGSYTVQLSTRSI